jgi:GT2 family glycosyltransferase
VEAAAPAAVAQLRQPLNLPRERVDAATGVLDVVIVSYRCRDHLRRCLTALEAHAPEGTRVWVVDNDSRDGTVEMVRGAFPAVEVIANDENMGFARATNLGIAAGDAPYVLALNPDTEIHADTLETLHRVMEAHPEIGIAGPALMRADGSFDHASRRSFPTLLGALGHFTGVGRRLERGRLAQYRAPEISHGPVDAVNGAFMFIRRAALDEVGLFDENYWMYMEDLDLCYRFKQAGWITWYEPKSVAMHVKGGSSGHRSPKLVLAFHSGMWRFFRTHYAPQRSALLRGVVYVGIGVRLLERLIVSVVAPLSLRLGRRN